MGFLLFVLALEGACALVLIAPWAINQYELMEKNDALSKLKN